jgi:hypothetical protein
MALAIHPWKLDPAARRFVVWMAIGTVFILGLVVAEELVGTAIW